MNKYNPNNKTVLNRGKNPDENDFLVYPKSTVTTSNLTMFGSAESSQVVFFDKNLDQ